MKKLKLKTARYTQYEQSFKRWLNLMGMSPQAQYYIPLHVREFFHFMEGREITKIRQISVKDIQHYFAYLNIRPNQRQGGGISANYYNKQLQALKKFSKYLWHHDKILMSVPIKRKVANQKNPVILNHKEISILYETTTHNRLLHLRDQVMLDVFYSCGLRRNEGVHLNIEDIMIDRRLLYVSKGKNYTQRYVPFTIKIANRIKEYMEWSRQDLLGSSKEKALLISSRGRRMDGQSMLIRVKVLQEKSRCSGLQKKQIGLHTLRHSIATHLLHAGMPLKQIAKMLGHKSIESTQIYTRLAHEL